MNFDIDIRTLIGYAVMLIAITCIVFGIRNARISADRQRKKTDEWYCKRMKEVSSGRLYPFKANGNYLVCPICLIGTGDIHKVYLSVEAPGDPAMDRIENGLPLFRWYARCNEETCGYEWVMSSRLEEWYS